MTRNALGQLGRYLITGGIAAIVDVGGFALLYRAGLALAAAAMLSFCVAALVNYRLSARFVFGARSSRAGFALFFAVALVGLAINVGATILLARTLGLLPELAKLGGVGIAFVINFAMNRAIVFRHDRSSPELNRSLESLRQQKPPAKAQAEPAGARPADQNARSTDRAAAHRPDRR